MATNPRAEFKSIFGGQLGIARRGNLISRKGTSYLQFTRPAVDATITVSAEGATTANTRDITIQLRDHHGDAIDYAEMFEIINFAASTMLDWAATGGSTGIQAGASGKLAAVIAKKDFKAITTTAGLWVGSYLDTGTDTGYLGIRLPNGRIIGGGLLTNA